MVLPSFETALQFYHTESLTGEFHRGGDGEVAIFGVAVDDVNRFLAQARATLPPAFGKVDRAGNMLQGIVVGAANVDDIDVLVLFDHPVQLRGPGSKLHFGLEVLVCFPGTYKCHLSTLSNRLTFNFRDLRAPFVYSTSSARLYLYARSTQRGRGLGSQGRKGRADTLLLYQTGESSEFGMFGGLEQLEQDHFGATEASAFGGESPDGDLPVGGRP